MSPPMCVDRPRYKPTPARAALSLTIVVLPIPASPPTSTTDGSPLRASAMARSNDGQLNAPADEVRCRQAVVDDAAKYRVIRQQRGQRHLIHAVDLGPRSEGVWPMRAATP